MNEKTVCLNEFGQWTLFRGLACYALERHGLTEKELGCSLWEFTESLDMSFEEVRILDLALWATKVMADAEELKNEIVKKH